MTAVASLFDDPLAGWANDDLLFAEATRTRFAALAPAALPVFDWPELRTQFARHDSVANAGRRASRKGGTSAALIGYASLIVAAVTPLIVLDGNGMTARLLGVLATLLAVAATIWGYAQLLTGRRKREWLTGRFLTERLRQLHFQFILAHFDLAETVMRDPSRLPEWQARRRAALAAFELNIESPVTAAFNAMQEDIAEEGFWLEPEWRKRAPAAQPTPERDMLFAMLANQRFAIQQRFSSLKTLPGIHSVASRAETVRRASDLLTAVVLVVTMAGGILLASGMDIDGKAIRATTAILALTTATIAVLRVFNEGLQLSSETERYRWYHAAVTALSRRYDRADAAGRIELLRDMERLSYQEMRWFLSAFQQARFVL